MFVAVLLSIYLLRGIVLACVVPPLEMWDEYQHLAYIDFVARTGQSPVYLAARVDPALLKKIVQLPASPSEWRQLSRYGVLTYAQYWDRFASRDVVPVDEGSPELYEAQHPPVYYWVVSPIYRRLGGNLPLAVCVLRLVNVGFTAIGLGAILFWLERVCRERRHAASLGLCVVLHPLFLLNADRVANDALAVMLGSLAIVWAMCLRPRFLALQSLGLGALIGLGVMTKATNLVLLPFAGFCLILLVFRKQATPVLRYPEEPGGRSKNPALRRTSEPASLITMPALIRAGLLLIAGAAIPTTQYFLQSLHRYGTITPMQEAVVNRAAHARFADYLIYAPISLHQIGVWRKLPWHWFVTDGLWAGGWSYIAPPHWMPALYGVLLLGGLCAWIISRFRTIGVNPFTESLVGTRILALCLAMLLGMSYHAIQSMVAWKGQIATTPWYASVVVPWMLIGTCCGFLVFRGARADLVVLLVPLLFVATEIHGIFFQMVPRYSCLPVSLGALVRLATLRPGWLGLATLTVSLVAELSLVAVAAVLIVRTKPESV